MTTAERPMTAGGTANAPIAPSRPLARVYTIPKRYYLDPAILELEKERIFGRTWAAGGTGR